MDLKPASAEENQEITSSAPVKKEKISANITVDPFDTSISDVLGKDWWKKTNAKFVESEFSIPEKKIEIINERKESMHRLIVVLSQHAKKIENK